LILALPHAVLKAENSSLPHKISGSIEIYSFWRVREKCISIWKKILFRQDRQFTSHPMLSSVDKKY
jgi:hypothetical protein